MVKWIWPSWPKFDPHSEPWEQTRPDCWPWGPYPSQSWVQIRFFWLYYAYFGVDFRFFLRSTWPDETQKSCETDRVRTKIGSGLVALVSSCFKACWLCFGLKGSFLSLISRSNPCLFPSSFFPFHLSTCCK